MTRVRLEVRDDLGRQVVQDRLLADGFEAGCVWDVHLVSVGQ